MTQENCRAPGYKDRQKRITLNGKRVWADLELIPLLKALNAAGLITRSHCSGHGDGEAFIAIRSENITRIEIHTRGEYKEVRIGWKTKFRRKRGKR